MQAAHMFSDASKATSPLAAFDYLLIERFKYACNKNVLDFDMAADLKADPPRIRFSH
jgi:hypothetical protein